MNGRGRGAGVLLSLKRTGRDRFPFIVNLGDASIKGVDKFEARDTHKHMASRYIFLINYTVISVAFHIFSLYLSTTRYKLKG